VSALCWWHGAASGRSFSASTQRALLLKALKEPEISLTPGRQSRGRHARMRQVEGMQSHCAPVLAARGQQAAQDA